MRAHEYLSQIKSMDIKIRQKQQEADSIIFGLQGRGIDYSADKVQSSPEDQMASAMARYADIIDEIKTDIDTFVRTKHRIIEQIQALPDVRHITVLYDAYVLYMPRDMIGESMGYSPEWISELKGQALTAFETTYTNLHEPML